MTYLLGFDHQVGLEFLLVTGLIKKGSIRNPLGYSVLPNEWENFVIEENLKEVMETTVTVTSVDRSRYYFIHYGNKDNLQHRPIDQFNGNVLQPISFGFLAARQQKLHKQVSNVLLSMRKTDTFDTSVAAEEAAEAEESFLDNINSEASKTASETSIGKIPGACWDENIGLDNIKSPNLCKLFDTEKTIPKHLLTAIFGEMIHY